MIGIVIEFHTYQPSAPYIELLRARNGKETISQDRASTCCSFLDSGRISRSCSDQVNCKDKYGHVALIGVCKLSHLLHLVEISAMCISRTPVFY